MTIALAAPRLIDLPWRVTSTSQLRPGDVFTTDAGSGVLIFVGQRPEALGFRCIPRDPVTAIDLSGHRHRDIYAGVQVRLRLDLDSLPECPVCDVGCDCTRDSAGCGHFGCWGASSAATCVGADSARLALYRQTARRTAA